jgi:Lipase (class 3)
MLVNDDRAPDYRIMRPFKEKGAHPHFPVYPRLPDDLVDAKTHPNPTVAHVLAACAGYAYTEVDRTGRQRQNMVSTVMARMGLAENRCRVVAEYVDAMFIRSTAFIVQSMDGRVVIVAYRGTEPTNLISWLTDVEVHAKDPAKIVLAGGSGGSSSFDVHAGFYRNVRATRYEVLNTLKLALAGRSILGDDEEPVGTRPGLEALYLTGHSLGGAMAAILGLMLMTDPDYRDTIGRRLRAVYTFGQPMIGPSSLGAAYDRIPAEHRVPVLRYIYRNDPVPRVPPRQTGSFAHFGNEYRYDGNWRETSDLPVTQAKDVTGFGQGAVEFLLEQVPGLHRLIHFPYSLADHFPQHYIEALTPAGTPLSEFGDHRLVKNSSPQPAGAGGPARREQLLDLVARFLAAAPGQLVSGPGRVLGSAIPRRSQP